MSKCAGNIPEFDDFEDNEEVERGRRIHRPQRSGRRKHPVRVVARGRLRSRACC